MLHKTFKVIAKIRKLESDKNIRQALAILKSAKKEIEGLENIDFPMQKRFIEVTQNYMNDLETIFIHKKPCYTFTKSKYDLDKALIWVFQNVVTLIDDETN